MRLPLIAQSDLTPEQRPIYEDMRAGIEKSFSGIQKHRQQWRIVGPLESLAA
jgi:4-carboxymuconolactone decarboxylase